MGSWPSSKRRGASAASPQPKASVCRQPELEVDEELLMSVARDKDKSLAERRQKREVRGQKKLLDQLVYEEPKRPAARPQKSKERGWYRVEGILSHRVVKAKNGGRLELKVKWDGY